MAYGDLKVRNLIWNTGSGDNTVVLSTLATQSYVTTNFAPKANPTFSGTINGVDLILSGNLTVSGTQTIINTSVLDVEDKNVVIGKVSSPSDTTADGGGWTLKGATDKTFNWLNATDSWTSSEHIEIASGKNLKVDGTTFFVDGTNNRVGIKTTSPVSSLNINVDSESNLGSGSDGIRLTSASMNAQFIRLGSSYNNGSVTGPGTLLYSSNKLSIRCDNSNPITFHTGSGPLERMRIDSSGRVGIGTQSPVGGDLVVENTTGNAGIALSRVFSGNVSGATNTPSFTFTMSDTATNDQVVASISPQALAGTGDAFKGQLRVFTAAENGTNTERFRIGDSGQLGVGGATYGSSGQVLTSGGASAAPSWTTISAAPEITAVADGAISAANKPCRMNDNGKVAEIKNTSVSAATGSNTDIPHRAGYTPQGTAVAWISDTKFVLFWRVTNDNNQLYGAVGTVSGTTISYGANTAISGYNYISVGQGVTASYDSQSDAVVVAYRFTQRQSPNQARWRIQGMTVSGTTISVNSTAYESGSDNTYHIKIVCDNKGGFAFSKVKSSQQWHIGAGTVSTAGAIAIGSLSHIANNIDAAYDRGVTLGYDPVNDRYVPFGRYSNNYVYYGIYTRTQGTNINNVTLNGSPVGWIASVMGECFDVEFDEVNSQFIIIYENTVSSNLRYRFGKIDAAKTSLGNVGENDLFTSSRMDTQGRIAYDKITGHAFWLYADSDGQNTKLLTVTISGTSASATAETIASHKEQGGLVVGCNGSGLVFTGVDKSDDSDIDTRAKQFAVTTSNLKAGTFVGFSNAAYSDGNTATISVVGNTTTQSGLTPSKTYYVQKAGTLSTGADDPSVVAGIALSSTKLLIKG